MDKLKMAHEYALEMAKQGIPLKSCKELAWRYADAMQAEADGRVNKECPDVLKDDWTKEVEKDAKFHGVGFVRFLNKDGFLSVERLDPKLVTLACNEQEEWQPDWSQAPVKTVAWRKTEFNECEWLLELRGKLYYNGKAPTFGYQGNWQDSLRKRP